MSHLEPTYLRYIYDGLVKGSIHPENAAELPDGLIGLYEEAFDESQAVQVRQKLLQRFAIWALLKKEVSAAFVAEVLGETEDEIQGFISNYSAWFNSPESGKYQLYHERLKVYLLQKMSEGEIHELHERLILRLEKAIKEQKTDELEWYGLEFLAEHLSVSAMLNGDGQKLLNLAYAQTHWQRQLIISKDYNWTKSGLHSVMTWASKYKDDEVIECGLQMVDLHHQEQNAAPQIVALVAEGDFESAMKRIEQFGGNDKEGLQRKFILYMLCLMELTLLDSKEKSFQKEGIEKLLKHLDEQLPVDHSVLNWNQFFSSYLIFQMAFIWEILGINYLIVFKRTIVWDFIWIKNFKIIGIKSLKVLLDCAELLPEKQKDETLKEISIQLTKSKSFRAAINCANLILDNSLKSQACLKISSELKNNKKDKLSDLILNTAIENALLIDNVLVKIRALTSISNYLISIGKKGDAIELSNSALRTIEEISNLLEKGTSGELFRTIKTVSISLSIISTNYEKLGLRKKSIQLIQQAIENSNRVNSRIKVTILRFIALELAIQGKNKKLNSVIQDAIDSALTIVADVPRNSAISELSIGLLELGHFKKAKILADKNTNLFDKGRALDRISLNLTNQGKIEEAIIIAQEIKNDFYKSISFLNIAVEMVKIGKYNEANHIALQLEVNKLFKLCEEFYKKKRFSEVYSLLYKMIAQETTNDISSRVKIISNLSKEKSLEQNYTDAIIITRSIDSNHNGTKSRLLASISTAMFEQGQTETSLLIIEEALQCALEDDHHIFMYENLKYIMNELIKQGNIEYALEILNHIESKSHKSIALSSLSTSLFIRGNAQLANKLLYEAKEITLSHSEVSFKDNSLFQLSIDLFKQGLHDESASMILLINDKVKKCEAITAISAFSRFQGNKEISVLKSTELLEIYNCLGNEINDSERDTVRCILTKELIYEGQDQKAKIFINEIKIDKIKHSALSALSEYLFINHRYQEAEQILMQLKNNIEKQKALHSIVKYVFDKSGLKEVYRCLTFFKIEELKFLWLIEIHKNIPLKEYNKDVIISILKTQAIDLKTLSVFLQKFALFELFYNKRTKNLSRYNHHFNLQWAIDIKNQLPN